MHSFRVFCKKGETPLKEINSVEVANLIESLCIKANICAPEDVMEGIILAKAHEDSYYGQAVLEDLLENIELARKERMPLCQDCGMVVVFVDWGQEVLLVGSTLQESIDEGVRKAYLENHLRRSVVNDPLYERKNTGDNTPAIVHCRLVGGNEAKFTVVPKGMGSENASALAMLSPADGQEGVINFVKSTVAQKGQNACPPLIVGVGIGGNFESAPILAKRSLLRPVGSRNTDDRYSQLEEKLLEEINGLGLGPGGYGGRVTALDVHVEFIPTHIAGLPVAVNVCCNALRHASGHL